MKKTRRNPKQELNQEDMKKIVGGQGPDQPVINWRYPHEKNRFPKQAA